MLCWWGAGKFPQHHNVNITNNTIAFAEYVPILVTTATGAIVADNTLINNFCQPTCAHSAPLKAFRGHWDWSLPFC